MAYLHKKFKKFASVENHEPEPKQQEPERRSPTEPHGASLKHSIGSLVDRGAGASLTRQEPQDISDQSESRHRPGPAPHVSAGPRYPYEPHPVYSRPGPGLTVLPHPDPSLVLLPSHLVKQPLPVPRLVVPQVAGYPPHGAPHPAYHLPPGIRFLDPASLPLSLAPAPQPEQVSPYGHSPQLVKPRFERPQQPQDLRQPEAGHHFPPGLAGVYLGKDVRVQPDRRDMDQVTRKVSSSSSSSSSHLSAETLEQRINKVISENQAIVETLDPFWKGRYMRQSSREEAARRQEPGTEQRVRRFSQGPPPGMPEQEVPSPHQHHHQQLEKNRQIKSHPHLPPNSYKEHSQEIAGGKYISNNVPQPPRPDSNIPLNLSDSGRKRKSPENPLIDAHSVKEVWLNSQKKAGNISQLEDIASKIEAKLRSSENPFHPENPEGSIIKDLLLKTRSGQIFVASTSEHSDQERLVKLAESANIPVNLQISPSGRAVCESDLPQHAVGIPIPKNFLPAQTKASGSVETSLYQCNLCNVTFKSLESIEIHQNHYCKNTKHSSNDVLRPNSTVSHASPRHEPREVRMFPTGPGERRKVESLTMAQGEPPGKRARADSYSGAGLVNGPANVTVTNTGLLQIAAPSVRGQGGAMVMSIMSSHSNVTTVTSRGNVPGIPTPNLSGVLTGIKSQPLFSLPGLRTDLATVPEPPVSVKHVPVTADHAPEKPVTFVLGIPGPHSQHLPVMAQTRLTHSVLTTSASGRPSHVSLPSLNVDTAAPVTRSSLNLHNPVLVSVPTLQSPATKLVTALSGAGQRQMISSPQRKYEFLANSKPESPGKGLSQERPALSPASRDHKPERPDSLALGAGPSVKKKDLGMTGATLISPETPRPKKAYVLSYQNGTAYTFLGLKCSTRVFFCSSHKPQPNYVQLEKNSKVSMYSNWKVVAKDSHPSGLNPRLGMSAYNSTQHNSLFGITAMAAPKKSLMITTHSSRWHERKAASHTKTSAFSVDNKKSHSSNEEGESSKAVRTVEGGYKSADDNYTYIRGRGRGKYICDTCGIRCKKPSMLKKHIRTHTNVRPYTCKYCNFSFKTKGNLTKHMKSKAHSKKCVELGIVPVPTSADDQQMDDSKGSGEIAFAGDSDTDDGDEDDPDDDDDDGDNGDFDDSRNESGVKSSEEESMGLAPRTPRFATYPFAPTPTPASSLETQSSSSQGGSAPPPCVTPHTIAAVNAMSEYEQLSRNSRLVEELRESGDNKYSPSGLGSPSTTRIWSLAHMADTRTEQTAADILSPVTESATILSYIDKTASRLPHVPPLSLESPEDTGLKIYFQERAAIRAKQQAVKYEEIEANKVVIKEEKLDPVPEKMEVSKPSVKPPSSEYPASAFSHTDSIPQNVTMNVKDMPTMTTQPGNLSLSPPEFNIPHISKADSPMRKTTPTSGVETMKIRTPESINNPGGGSQAQARSSDSPASGSSGQSETETGAAKPEGEKGSMISTNPQEIFQTNEDGKSVCGICKKVFSKPSQLRLHVNIHYFERPFRCDACAVSFRTKGHLQKHKRSVGHFNKVNINATFGAPSTDNPRPFKCGDCMIAFRIHGHLAKHLRSKMHIMKLECIGKLPIGMYAEMERLGTNLNEIDTTDCENSLESLQQIAVKLYEKDPSKLTSVDEAIPAVSTSSDLSDDEEEDSNLAEIKQEPMEVVPNMSLAPPPEAEHSTDSDTDSFKPGPLAPSHHVAKPLVIPAFHEARRSPPAVLNLTSQPRQPSHSPDTGLGGPASCHICGLSLPNQLAFQQHLHTHAQVVYSVRPYICPLCDAGFTSLQQLDAHSRLHAATRPS